MTELVFLLEEGSMRELLHGLLPRLLPAGLPYRLVTHDGKTDLLQSLPRKLRGWRTPGARFVVLCDKDADDCRALKQKIVALCSAAGRPDALVRIVCHHLEAWYLGDLPAVEAAFDLTGVVEKLGRRRLFRQPDEVANASQELKKLAPAYQKVKGSRAIAPCLDLTGNSSPSFRVFVEGLHRLVAQTLPVE